LALPALASAQQTLTYASSFVYAVAALGPLYEAVPTVGEDISGVITLSHALPENGTVTVTALSSAWGLNGNTIFQSTLDPLKGSFTFTTTNGAITAFSFSQQTPWSGPGVDTVTSDGGR